MLKQRVLTAIVLLAGFLSALFYLPQPGWLLLVALVSGGGAWEWGGMADLRKPVRIIYAIAIGIAAFVCGLLAGLSDLNAGLGPVTAVAYVLSALFWLAVIPVWLARKWTMNSRSLQLTVGVIVLVPPALALAHLRSIDATLLLGILVLVWVADIAAYFTGRTFGRTKLAPTISPGKTWEGAAGAAVGVMLVGVILSWAWPLMSVGSTALIWLLPLLVLFTAVSIIGDLFESLLKRQAGIKDSGNLLPGHGGILDRIDSITSAVPVTALIVTWWLI